MVGHAATLARANSAAAGIGADVQQQKHANDLAKLVQAARDAGAMFSEAAVRKHLQVEAAQCAGPAATACIRRARPAAEAEVARANKRSRTPGTMTDCNEDGERDGGDERGRGDGDGEGIIIGSEDDEDDVILGFGQRFASGPEL